MDTRRRVALLSVGAGAATLLLKFIAYWWTGSVGLLSDAAESGVNLAAALFAFVMISYACRPPDYTHHYGHEKAEYLSSTFEGGLILLAAGGIIYAAVRRLLHPVPLHELGHGVIVALLASAINFAVARVLLHYAQKYDSIALEADAQHLLTDVWTSLGVVVGVTVAGVSGWYILDPLIALVVAGNIVRVGGNLLRRSMDGLLDRALPSEEIALIRSAIVDVVGPDIPYHGLRTRKAGNRRFVDFHLLVPGHISVRAAHRIADRIEHHINEVLPNTHVTIHIEPLEDASSWDAEDVGGLSSDRG